MPNQAFKDHIQDYALGHLLIDVAKIDLQNIGAPVSDEELSVFVEVGAKMSLGQRRCEQILAHLCIDDHLYQRWLMLSQSSALDGEFTPAPPTRLPKSAKQTFKISALIEWINPFFAPRFSFSSILGVMVITFLGAYVAMTPMTDSGLVSHKGDTLPEKASYGDVSSNVGVDGSSAQEKIGANLRCAVINQLSSICYSNTLEQQNWYVIYDAAVRAVKPLVIANKIISVRTHADKLLIEYSDQVEFRLILMQVNINTGGWDAMPLHEDAVVNGYFDRLQLGAEQLSYEKKVSDLPAEEVIYQLEQP